MKTLVRQVFNFAINGGLDPSSADALLLRRMRMVNFCTLLATLFAFVSTLQQYLVGQTRAAMVIALGTLAGVMVWLMVRRWRDPDRLGYVATTVLFFVLVAANALRTGPAPVIVPWLFFVPTFAGLMVGLRALILFSIAVIAAQSYFAWTAMPMLKYTFTGVIWQDLLDAVAVTACIAIVTAWFLLERARIEQQLEKTVAKLQKANSAKTDFVARMSHEIRTPINALIGMTQILRNTKLDAAQRDYVETIRSSGESLAALVGNILDFARIESAKARLEPVRFDPRTQLEDIVALFAQAAADKGIQLLWYADIATPMRICADETRLRQILVNLVNNALKFTDKGQIIIDLHVQALGEQTTLVYLVEDTGIGIAPDKLDYIFEPFAQADESATRSYGGAGLGLAICRDLAVLMGGSLSVSSQLGKGTTFRLALPVLSDVADLAAERKVLDGLHVALVCPDGAAARHVCGQLLWLGASVAEFSSLRVAQAWADNQGKAGQAYTAILCHANVLRQERRAVELLAKQHEQASGRLLGRLLGAAQSGLTSEWGWPDLFLPLERRKLAAWFAAGSGVLAPNVGSEFTPQISLKGHVLVVEDNSVNQKVIRLLLERFGVSVQVVADGQQALAAVQQSHFDLLLMDCEMPNMNGYDATSAIRRLPGLAHVPIIAVTAHAGEAERQRCLAVGMNEVLAKPVREEVLFATLSRWLPEDNSVAARYRRVVRLNEEVYRYVAVKAGATEEQESLASIFERTVRQALDHIDAALFREDAAQVRSLAHAIKGSAAAIGAERLSKMSEDVEKVARGRELALAKSLAQLMRQEFFELLDLLSIDQGFLLRRAAKPSQGNFAAK